MSLTERTCYPEPESTMRHSRLILKQNRRIGQSCGRNTWSFQPSVNRHILGETGTHLCQPVIRLKRAGHISQRKYSMSVDEDRLSNPLKEELIEFFRILEISAAAVQFCAFLCCQKVSILYGKSYDREQEALYLQAILTRLGPTFVKLAQTASMRPDLIGNSYSKSLSRLQDSVEPFDNVLAYEIIEKELGKSISDVFVELSVEPVASASMGQVYRGVLAEAHGGFPVAVKVRRPGAYQSIRTDINLLRNTIGIIQKAAGITRDLRLLVDEVGSGLLGECDFRNEVKNSKEFFRAHRDLQFITIPFPVEELCTSRLFVSEWIDGSSPTQLIKETGDLVAEENILSLVRMGIQCSLSQLLVTGCMHGDPHSGNLLLTKNGQLCYLDFGLLINIPPKERQAMMAALVHLGLGEWKRLVDDLEELELLKPGTDKCLLAEDLEREFLVVMQSGDNQESNGTSDMLRQLPLLTLQTTKLNFSTLIGVLFKLAFKYKFLLPSFFPLVVRSVSSLEGVALAVDPDFKLVAAGMPVVLNQLLSDRREASQNLLQELLLMPGGALRADDTTAQILQVWLSAAEQAERSKPLSERSSKNQSQSGVSASAAMDLKDILLDRRNVPLRRTIIMSNPAATIAQMSPETRSRLLDILTQVLSSDEAGELASGMLRSTPAARAQRKRLFMLFKATIPKVAKSPINSILELLKFTFALFCAFIQGFYKRLQKKILSWFNNQNKGEKIE